MRALVVTELGLSREKALAQKGLSMFKMQHAQQKRYIFFRHVQTKLKALSLSPPSGWLRQWHKTRMDLTCCGINGNNRQEVTLRLCQTT